MLQYESLFLFYQPLFFFLLVCSSFLANFKRLISGGKVEVGSNGKVHCSPTICCGTSQNCLAGMLCYAYDLASSFYCHTHRNNLSSALSPSSRLIALQHFAWNYKPGVDEGLQEDGCNFMGSHSLLSFAKAWRWFFSKPFFSVFKPFIREKKEGLVATGLYLISPEIIFRLCGRIYLAWRKLIAGEPSWPSRRGWK